MLQPLLWLLVAVLSISSSSWAGEDRCVTVQQFSIANSKAESFFIDGEHTTLELALTTASRGVIVEYRDGGQWYRLPASRVVSAEGIRISVRDIGEYHMEYEYADPCSGTVSRRVGIRGVFKIRK